MTVVALTICLLLSAFGAVGAVSPATLLGVVRKLESPMGLYAAAGIRVVFGVALVFAAPASLTPNFMRFLGIFIAAAGFVTPFFGVERFRKLLDWWAARGPALVRGWAIVAMTLGLALAYAIVPRR